ncbi:MAG: hypothetical protein U5K77_02910 [Candidatus Saccharibacteria bacterium]|nr:hypothetical protein [Candidatus Saccharibacteria bacterium]
MSEKIDVSRQVGVGRDELWMPDHTLSYDIDRSYMLLEKLERVAGAVGDSICQAEIDQSLEFAENAVKQFTEYKKGGKVDERRGHTFLIPVTVSETEEAPGESYEEIKTALPMLHYVDAMTRHRTLLSLPPCEVGRYEPFEGSEVSGIAMYTPITAEIANQNDRRQALKIARNIVNETVDFAATYHGSDVVGLGGVIPAFTRFGKKIDVDVETTTGHAGTVRMIAETVDISKEVFNIDESNSLSLIGCGSIGSAFAEYMLESQPGTNLHVYDDDRDTQQRMVRKLRDMFGEERVVPADNIKQAIEASIVTVSAVIGSLAENEGYDEVDFYRRVLIDDSHPPSVSRNDIENRGGNVMWVIGDGAGIIKRLPVREDMPSVKFCGGKVALESDVWGCEAEVGALAATRAFGAINSPVTSEDVHAVGRAFKELSIGPSAPQSFGRLINPKVLSSK